MNESPLVNNGWAFVAVRGDHNNVNVNLIVELIGLLILGLLAVLLLVGWRRSERRYQKLVEYVIDER